MMRRNCKDAALHWWFCLKKKLAPVSWFLWNLVSVDIKINLPVLLAVTCYHKSWETESSAVAPLLLQFITV